MEKQIKKLFNFEIKNDESDNSLIAIGSSEIVDRDGDIVKVDGIDLKYYKKNPLIPWAHDYHQPPIGRAEKIRVEDGKLTFKAVFATEANPQAKIIYDLYKGNFLNSFSIGFLAQEWTDETRKDGKSGRNYTKTQLLEISACSVPSNPEALVIARGLGLDTSLIEQELEEKETPKEDISLQFKQLKDDIATEFAKLTIRLEKQEEMSETFLTTLKEMSKPQTSNKELFSEEIKKFKNFTINK